MKTKHTPGPWKAEILGGNKNIVIYTPVKTDGIVNIYPSAEAEANARLIAAAPELLAELKNIVASLHEAVSMTSEEKHFNARWKRELIDARKAISKAEGGQ